MGRLPSPQKPGASGPLRTLSRSLLRLSEQAQQVAPQDLLHQVMQTLQGLVPFDSAWWGEVSAGDVQTAPRNWLHGCIGLSRSFAEEWNALAAVDLFGLQSMQQLGVVIRERDAVGPEPDHPDVVAFSQRHGLHHCMALTAELPHSGLMFLSPSTARQPGRSFRTARPCCLASSSCTRCSNGTTVCSACKATRPAAPGTALPLPGRRANCCLPGCASAGRWAKPAPAGTAPTCRLRLEPCGPLVAVSMASRQHKQALAPRELSAAMLYAQGRSHKDIEATLGLTPATVRTYLRTAYAALGVSNNLELVAALRHQ